jgi:uncharacterized protein (DUF2249 family)
MLERHPTWSMDIELQAYMIEVLAERHSDVLDRLRALAESGQVELVSFHYSDQLWTAYPARDQAFSLDETRRVFSEHDLPLSRVVFSQEGQMGPGALLRMGEWGYDIAILPHNLAEHIAGAEPTHALWDAGGVTVIMGGTGEATEAWSMGWHFMDDGEL